MAYQDKPNPNDQLSQSQSDIRNNFLDINSLVSLNHVTFNMGADSGKHKFLQMPEQLPVPATAANEMALYTKQGSSGLAEMFIRKESNGIEIEFTNGTLVGGLSSTGFTALPSGILLKWGSVAVAAAGASAVVFDATIPFAQVYVVMCTPLNAGGAGTQTFSVSSASITNAGCTLIYGGSGPSPITVQYLAIGRVV